MIISQSTFNEYGRYTCSRRRPRKDMGGGSEDPTGVSRDKILCRDPRASSLRGLAPGSA